MGTFPIKVLIDENNEEFIPWMSADGIHTSDGLSFEEKFATKIDASNLKEGTGITIVKDGADCTFNVDFGASDNIIDNLDTTVAGQGSLDARQGSVLKGMIPQIVDNTETADASKVLSANQGHELSKRSVPEGGLAGQVLKKSSDNKHELEWGDAADPNALGGAGSIRKLIDLPYAAYKTLESNGELQDDTEYHINDMDTIPGIGAKASQVEMSDGTNVEENINELKGFTEEVRFYFEEEFDPRLTEVETYIGTADEINNGQNTRLDVIEGNIDTMAGTINGLLERTVVETAYLGSNPDIDLYHARSGIYGIYNCAKAPNTGIGVLEVLYYSYDWTIQRFTNIGETNVMHMWERCFHSGTTWTAWIQRW